MMSQQSLEHSVFVHKLRHKVCLRAEHVGPCSPTPTDTFIAFHPLYSFRLCRPPLSCFCTSQRHCDCNYKCFLRILQLVAVNHLGQAACFHNTLPITVAILSHKHVFPFSIVTYMYFSPSFILILTVLHPHAPFRSPFFF